MIRTPVRPAFRTRLWPVLRAMLDRVLVVVLALSFAAALSVPTRAMGPDCADAPAAPKAFPVATAHEATGAAHTHHHGSGHPDGPPGDHGASGDPAGASSHGAEQASALQGAPQRATPPADARHPCCLASCPACLPAVTAAPRLAAPTGTRQVRLFHTPLLPDGLPPGEALDPPRSATA